MVFAGWFARRDWARRRNHSGYFLVLIVFDRRKRAAWLSSFCHCHTMAANTTKGDTVTTNSKTELVRLVFIRLCSPLLASE